MAPPRIFISYAWESEEYRLWVERLATRLRENGVDARLDRWHLQEGSIPDFMNREVRKADKVLVLCSPMYRTKVHLTEDGERMTGSGWEAGLLSSRLFANLGGSERKALPALARGTWQESAPDFLLGEVYVDLSREEGFEESYRMLLQRITGQTSEAPPLGALPDDLRPDSVTPLRGTEGEDGAEASGEKDSPDLTLRFNLEPSGDNAATLELQIDDETLSTAFDIENLRGDSQAAREILAIEGGDCTADDIQNLGSELWTMLMAGETEARVAAARRKCRDAGGVLQLRFAVAPELESLPLETLFDFDEGPLATSPGTSVVRMLHGRERSAKERTEDGPLKVLVVIPSGSGLETSAEWEKIRQSVRALGSRVVLECLDGQVTPDRFADTLRRGWDVVHFIGHGDVDDLGRVRLRFNAAGDGNDDGSDDGSDGNSDGASEAHWLVAPMFAQLFLRSPAQLVVLNCCHGGAVHHEAGNGPRETGADALGSLGGFLRKAGVPAVVVMRYALADSVAADFSRALYHELLAGPKAGRIDLAVQEGRATLLRNYADGRRARSYITPALYLARGREHLFELTVEEQRTGVALADVPIDPRIPAKLVHAVKTGRCLPILGPGVLGASALRDAPAPPGPRDLAQRLGEESQFPGHDRITPLLDSSCDWLTPVLLERICQHFETVSLDERAGLTGAIQTAYRDQKPSEEMLELASWNVQGLVYSHVDGLLERALYKIRGRNLRVVEAGTLDDDATPGDDDLVLLNLRGNYATPTSLVLTERDQDLVLDRIPEIASFVEDLMNATPGCALVFLGISPRDPLVRALSRRLLRDEVSRNRGTAYFISQAESEADKAYWRFDRLEWLDLDLETVLRGLSTAAAQAALEAGESG